MPFTAWNKAPERGGHGSGGEGRQWKDLGEDAAVLAYGAMASGGTVREVKEELAGAHSVRTCG
jgi:hypothetical protein